jgi:hypothetical protein
MGYYTKYSLDEVVGDKAALIRVLREEFSMDLSYVEASKWYEHESEMRLAMARSGVSKVVLHLEGENRGDVQDKEFTVDTATGLIGIRRFKGRWVRNAEPES